MGKKAREKREKQLKGESNSRPEAMERNSSVFLAIIRWASYLILFTPLVVSGNYFFPFVGPKSLYFMALAQVIFFTWLLLIIYNPQYRPKLNIISIALILFLAVLILSAFLGEDLSRSFWSKYERMTGVLMWLHLFVFFLAISNTFKKWKDWFGVFSVSVIAAVIIALISLFIKAGVDFLGPSLTEASRGGATLGNTSFLGAYLLFNFFIALYLVLKSAGIQRICFLVSLPIMFIAVYLANARAATLSIIIGLALLALLYCAFASRKNILSVLGKVGLVVGLAVFLINAFYVFQPDNIIHNWFVEQATYARLVVWEGSWQGFLEKPLLGWGPENFDLIFTKHFNPCMFLGECGGEIWFDRAHNIIVDTLATTGILGLLAYLGIFAAVFYALWKRYFFGPQPESFGAGSDQRKKVDFWSAGIFSVVLIAYFIQNLTVFDMVSSYLMLFLVLGFISYLISSQAGARGIKFQVDTASQTIFIIILILFIFSFFKFVVQPVQSNMGVIDALRTKSPRERTLLAEKALNTSSLGKYQIRETFADRAINFYQSEEANNSSIDELKIELDFLITELEKSTKESSSDFRAYFKLGQTYNFYIQVDGANIPLAESALIKAIELAPSNQQGYWALAQTRLYQNDLGGAIALAEKALELEPRVLNSHFVLFQIVKLTEDENLKKKKVKEALEINPDWAVHFEDYLE